MNLSSEKLVSDYLLSKCNLHRYNVAKVEMAASPGGGNVPVDVYRVGGPNPPGVTGPIPWKLTTAYNFGFFQVGGLDSEYVLKVDCDTYLSPRFFEVGLYICCTQSNLSFKGAWYGDSTLGP